MKRLNGFEIAGKEKIMLKNIHYVLLLTGLIVFTGCETIKDTTIGAATGFGQDVQNIANPDKNGWNAIKNVDAWMQEHMW